MEGFEHIVKVIGHQREGEDLDVVARFTNCMGEKHFSVPGQSTFRHLTISSRAFFVSIRRSAGRKV